MRLVEVSIAGGGDGETREGGGGGFVVLFRCFPFSSSLVVTVFSDIKLLLLRFIYQGFFNLQ